MKIGILGATGRTGRPLLEQALRAGHDVTVLVRTPSKLDLAHEHLRVLQGDSMDAAAVERLVEGQDVIISVLGPVKPAQPGLMKTTASNLVNAMKKHNVRRLVYLTGAGVQDPKDPPSFAGAVIVPLMKVMAGAMLADSEAGARLIQASDLDWTIVRGPRLGDNPPRGQYVTGYIRTGFTEVSRADVADFMLKEATRREYVRESPVIYYA
jgi:putative NADH-flavin reductase